MRVILMSSSSGSEGGGEQYLIRLATGLARAGVEVLTAMSKHPRMDALERACAPFGEVRRINYRNLYDRRLRTGATLWARLTLGPLKEFFRSVRADVIHINKQNVEDGLDLLLAAQAVGAPTVSTIHITRSMQALGARAGVFRDWMANRILRRSPAQFITVARHCANDLINGCRGLAASRVHTVWNGVDAALAANRDVYRQEWQCKKTRCSRWRS